MDSWCETVDKILPMLHLEDIDEVSKKRIKYRLFHLLDRKGILDSLMDKLEALFLDIFLLNHLNLATYKQLFPLHFNWKESSNHIYFFPKCHKGIAFFSSIFISVSISFFLLIIIFYHKKVKIKNFTVKIASKLFNFLNLTISEICNELYFPHT